MYHRLISFLPPMRVLRQLICERREAGDTIPQRLRECKGFIGWRGW